jgi:hypothetical protein
MCNQPVTARVTELHTAGAQLLQPAPLQASRFAEKRRFQQHISTIR